MNDILGVIAIIIMVFVMYASNDKDGMVKGFNNTIKSISKLLGGFIRRVNRV